MWLDSDSRIEDVKPRAGVFRPPRDLDLDPLGRVSNGIEYEIRKGAAKHVVFRRQHALGFRRVSRTATSYSTFKLILTNPRLGYSVSTDPDLNH